MMTEHREWGEERSMVEPDPGCLTQMLSPGDPRSSTAADSAGVADQSVLQEFWAPDRKVPWWPRQEVRKGPLGNHCLGHGANNVTSLLVMI